MAGSDHLFQLDEDDIFSSDSFLEELEQVEKVECVVSKPKQAPPHHGLQQDRFSKASNVALSTPKHTATPVIPQAKTPVRGEGRKFSFKSKTSPVIPLPPDTGIHKTRDSSVNIGDKTGVDGKQHDRWAKTNTGHGSDACRKGPVTPDPSAQVSKHPPQNVSKIPSPLANLRQLNANPFKSGKGTANQTNEVDKRRLENDSSDVLNTSLGDFKEPSSKTVSGGRKNEGMLRPAGSAMLKARPQEVHVRKENLQSGAGVSGNLGTPGRPGQSRGNVGKPMMTSPPQGPCPPHQQDTPRTTHKPPCTPSSSMSQGPYGNITAVNTPTSSSAFRGRLTGQDVQQRNRSTTQSSNTVSGGNLSPGFNQSRGMSSASHAPHSRTSMSGYGTPSGNCITTPGSSVRTPNMPGRGRQTPGTGQPQRQHTPVGGHAKGQHTPVAGHAHRQHPSVNKHLYNQRQSSPGQPARPVLTPRVAQLCKGSGPSPGTGAVHGGIRKFPGPAGLLPKLTPGQKLKDAAAALKKKAEEEEMSQEAEESSEDVADVGDFEHGAWFRMKTELGIKDRDPNSILQQNNIALVIRKASLKQLTKNKVNHLCVMIKTISLNSSDASVTLCDPSGEMQGTVHRRLIEEYQGDLRPGSVLVLRQVGVLSPSQRNHYLNITPSNLIQVFPGESTSKPGSQKTPKRTRKRSGKTPSRKHPSETLSSGHRTDKSPTPGRRDGEIERLGSDDALDVVAMETDNYVEDEDAGIWEEMLDDEDEEDVLVLDTQVGGNDLRSRLDSKEEEPAGNRNDGVGRSKSSSCSSASALSSKPVTTQTSPAPRLSPTSPTSSIYLPTTSTLSSMSTASSGMLPVATKRYHPAPSKPTPSMVNNLGEMKRPCLREISGLGSNKTEGNPRAGPTKGPVSTRLSSCREESIGDLLDGLEDELFDDF